MFICKVGLQASLYAAYHIYCCIYASPFSSGAGEQFFFFFFGGGGGGGGGGLGGDS